MLLSWPHFYNADPDLVNNVDGLSPDRNKHEFQIDILPQLGVGLRAAIRLQINIFIEVDGVSKLEGAKDAYVPIIWFEDGIEELDDEETIDLLQSAVIEPALIHSILYPVLFAVGILAILVNLYCLSKRFNLSGSSSYENSAVSRGGTHALFGLWVVIHLHVKFILGPVAFSLGTRCW